MHTRFYDIPPATHLRQAALTDEGIGVQVLDWHGLLDDIVFEVEFLHYPHPLGVERAERRGRLGVVHVGDIAAQDTLNFGFFAGMLRHRGDEVAGRGGRIGDAVAN